MNPFRLCRWLGFWPVYHLKESSDMGIPWKRSDLFITRVILSKNHRDVLAGNIEFYLDFNKLPMIPILDEKINRF
jgi:hypothetical protein